MEGIMAPAEPEYTAIAKGISAEMWSAEIKSRNLNLALRALLYIAGILIVVLVILFFVKG
jgi:hypothetical protein